MSFFVMFAHFVMFNVAFTMDAFVMLVAESPFVLFTPFMIPMAIVIPVNPIRPVVIPAPIPGIINHRPGHIRRAYFDFPHTTG
jgi:hypothetical protein